MTDLPAQYCEATQSEVAHWPEATKREWLESIARAMDRAEWQYLTLCPRATADQSIAYAIRFVRDSLENIANAD